MAPQTRPRARSSVENLFDLVENLQEDQLQDLLHELNSTPNDPNIDVSSGISYFEQQRRRDLAQHKLRPTPSFLNAPHEPTDWPRQKPRPVSGSQWRQSMRIVSAPYATTGRSSTAPISPPLTASPPASPPMKRSATMPTAASTKIDTAVVSVQGVPSPVSPPRHSLEDHEDEEGVAPSRPSLSEFGAFNFGGDGAADSREAPAVPGIEAYTSDEEQGSSGSSSGTSRPVSPTQAAPAVTVQNTEQQLPTFNRINTMPLLTAADKPAMRPRTATGHAAASAKDNPRAFRRISRPQFLSPVHAAPDEMARKLMSAFLFGDSTSPPSNARAAPARRQEENDDGMGGLEAMLKGEPASPRSRFVFGRVEREAPPVSGIFEVLTEG